MNTAGITLSLTIGQHVRHADHKGRRVTGHITALAVEDRAVMATIALDEPIILPSRGEFGETRIHTQHVPAHELAPFDERDELIADMLAALQGVVRVADRQTAEFDAARAAIVCAIGARA